MKKDLNKIAGLEKAIKEKYGKEAVQNPRANWTPEKEKRYLESIKKKEKKPKEVRTIPFEEFEIKENKLRDSLDQERTCPVCNKYSFKYYDDLYMNKFNCCQKCYIMNIEGRNPSK